MSNWDEIKKDVESNGNILTVSMITLREAAGKDKLGTNVVKEISTTLAGIGLGHVPKDLPASQSESIRLYKRGTSIGDLIEKVLFPSESNDRALKELLNNESANETAHYANIIEQIRELVL